MTYGATPTRFGTRFVVHSIHPVELVLFDPAVTVQMDRTGNTWVVEVAGIGPGAEYLFRVNGRDLQDPYAREWAEPLRWSPELQDGLAPPPRCVVAPARPSLEPLDPPVPWSQTVIYETHVRGLTMEHPKIPEAFRGTFPGLASKPVIKHLLNMGVTAVQLLPVQAFADDRFVVERGLSNFWGYQPLGFFAPDPRYGTLAEFRHMVRALHKAGIEVLLDIVFNHTGEGDETGPTVSFRGFDDAYYRYTDGRLANEAGTGNTLDLTNPVVQRLVMDALRFWAAQGVDGFRFDLAPVLGRGPDGFSPRAVIFDMIRQDPALRDLKLIVEPWDMAGHHLGQFPPPFAEWNDRFRDDIRRFWRGERVAGGIASGLTGSAPLFDHDGRGAWTSINHVTTHDGFTLTDLVSFAARHNDANGEDGRDGHPDDLSDNMGTEGPDSALDAARALRRRNMLATVLLAQGTPMIRAGDEMGNSQGGNNNAYAQDNPVGWVQWGDPQMRRFTSLLTALRENLPVLRQSRFLHDGDVDWQLPDGRPPAPDDWSRMTTLCLRLRGDPDAFIVLNPGPAVPLTLPEGNWHLMLDTTQPDADLPEWGVEAPAHSVLVFRHLD